MNISTHDELKHIQYIFHHKYDICNILKNNLNLLQNNLILINNNNSFILKNNIIN